jgi:glycine dehydrogenase subunit 2
MQWGTLQPFAGAHGEFVGMKLFRAYFDHRGEKQRNKILVPDSAHGTNPASAHISGFKVVEIPSDREGMVDISALKEHLDAQLAGIMLTNPNTLGIFERNIGEIADLVHEAGGLLYYDGANLNAIMGKARPGDMGFDVVHLNLHKTFSTPHGGGGPGAGPVLVNNTLAPYLPLPDIVHNGEKYTLSYDKPKTIGRITGFYGNIGVLIRAYCYLMIMGKNGLEAVAERSVLNANYLKEMLKERFELPYDTVCKHEFVLSGKPFKQKYGVTTLDIAKRLLDFNVHPPTIYFPLVVPEAMMIEPPETESPETLDAFSDIMERIADEIEKEPNRLKNAPHTTAVRRVDELRAAKHPVVRWKRE